MLVKTYYVMELVRIDYKLRPVKVFMSRINAETYIDTRRGNFIIIEKEVEVV